MSFYRHSEPRRYLSSTMTDRFDCFYCRDNLQGKKYVMKDDKHVCVRCFEKKCANTCAECRRPIGVDAKELHHKNRHWHEGCFNCAKCSKSLISEPFCTVDNRIMCERCSARQDGTRCQSCYKLIMPGTKSVEYKHKVWHEECFKCLSCRQPIGSQSFIAKGDDIYCATCQGKNVSGQNCAGCNEPISSGGVTYQDKPWHSECFVCASCKKSLTSIRFTTKDDKMYCVGCYKSDVADKCMGCKNPITGFGRGTKVVNYEGHTWHDYCFNCKKCSMPMANRRFVLKGENVYCADCAKKM